MTNIEKFIRLSEALAIPTMAGKLRQAQIMGRIAKRTGNIPALAARTKETGNILGKRIGLQFDSKEEAEEIDSNE